MTRRGGRYSTVDAANRRSGIWARAVLIFWVPIFICLFASPVRPYDSSVGRLKEKMVEIHNMDNTIRKKYEQIVAMTHKLENMSDELAGEILVEKEKRRLSNYSAAVENPRIAFNLQLLRRLNGTLSVLNHRIDYFKEGRQRLAFLSRQAEDDVMIMHTVSKMAIDRLIGKIDQTLSEYQAASHAHMIDVDRILMENREETFERLMLN